MKLIKLGEYKQKKFRSTCPKCKSIWEVEESEFNAFNTSLLRPNDIHKCGVCNYPSLVFEEYKESGPMAGYTHHADTPQHC